MQENCQVYWKIQTESGNAISVGFEESVKNSMEDLPERKCLKMLLIKSCVVSYGEQSPSQESRSPDVSIRNEGIK